MFMLRQGTRFTGTSFQFRGVLTRDTSLECIFEFAGIDTLAGFGGKGKVHGAISLRVRQEWIHGENILPSVHNDCSIFTGLILG